MENDREFRNWVSKNIFLQTSFSEQLTTWMQLAILMKYYFLKYDWSAILGKPTSFQFFFSLKMAAVKTPVPGFDYL